MNLPEAFIGETERIVAHFNANAKPCQKHKERPVIRWDGCWMIDCLKGCKISDGDHHGPSSLIQEWATTHSLRK